MRRPSHLRRGDDAECQARQFLEQAGLRLIQPNFTARSGEIDLIMREGSVIVFVEVRYRHSLAFGGPLESITASKQRKLKTTAQLFLSAHCAQEPECRFDVVSLNGPLNGARIEWIKNAF